MSRIVEHNETITIIPSGYSDLTNLTTNTQYPITSGYTDTASTTYARFTLSTSTTGYLYYTFNVDGIPSNATITSITGQVKARVSSTSRVTNTVCQLYAGTTAKGSNVTFASTDSANIVTLSQGTSWTVSELSNLRLRIGGTGSSSSQSKYIYFYGASITINYNYTVTEYDITVTNSSTNIGSVVPSNGTYAVDDGGSYQIKIYGDDISGINVLDNGNNVNNQVVWQEYSSGNTTINPSSYDEEDSNSSSSSSGHTNACTSTDSTTYATLAGGSRNQYYYYYDFGPITLPTNSTLTSIKLDVKGCKYSTYSWTASLCDGTTEIQTANITATTSSSYSPSQEDASILTLQTSDLNDTSDIKLKLTPTTGSSNIRLFLYGANLTINYEVEGGFYQYIISNINADHTIVVEDASSSSKKSYVKKNNTFIESTNQYVKESNSWINRTISKIFWKINGSWTERNDSMSGKTAFKIES